MTRPHTRLLTVELQHVHPTQLTVGMREVQDKRDEWRQLKRKARIDLLASHWFPGVVGPGQRPYIVDHHHLGLALLEEGVKHVFVLVLKDLSWVTLPHFWRVMDMHQWVHPYGADGQRHPYDTVPPQLTALQDDPYRSLAGELRRAGGYAKDATPFSEFLWADFLRARIDLQQLRSDFDKALKRALKLAHGQDARYLPGWAGTIEPATGPLA